MLPRRRTALGSPGRIALPGLDEGATYQVTVPGPQVVPGLSTGPQWLREPIDLSGRFLGTVGLQAPALPVDELVLIRAERVGS